MKYAVLIGDGMADDPVPELDGKTPLEAAHTPHMDALAQRASVMGLARMVPEGYEPGSDVANMSILGYDPRRYFTGRAPLEAASMGIELGSDDVAIRCNLVTLAERDGRTIMADYSAGHISTDVARWIIEYLRPKLELEDHRFEFYPGVGYRHLLVWRGGRSQIEGAKLTPPHGIPDEPVEPYLPRGNGSDVLRDLMARSQELLAPLGGPATSIWLWSAGPAPNMPTLQERFGLSGSVISAVDLVRGLGVLAGLKIVRVPGTTGYIDTNYRGKVQAALEALKAGDALVYVHVEAPDEVSHEGDVEKKLQAIEDFDAQVIGPIVEGLQPFEAHSVLLLPDHPTSLKTRVHTPDPVPFVICHSREGRSRQVRQVYSERVAREAGLFIERGHELLGRFLERPTGATDLQTYF